MRTIFSPILHLIICLPIVIGLFSFSWWLFDIFSNFLIFYLYLSFFLVLFFIIHKEYIFIIFYLLLATSLTLKIINLNTINDKTNDDNNSTSVIILSLNVNMNTREYETIKTNIQLYSPDILIFLEFNKVWQKEINAILSSDYYPFSHSIIRNNYFGIGLYSRFRIIDAKIDYYSGIDIPTLTAIILVNNKRLKLRAIHLDWPIFRRNAINRNKQLFMLADAIKNDNEASIAIGDFNLTPWSNYYNTFISKSETKACNTFPIHGSWPGISRYLAIPIDHCFYNNGIHVENAFYSDHTGSDHFPLIVDFHI